MGPTLSSLSQTMPYWAKNLQVNMHYAKQSIIAEKGQNYKKGQKNKKNTVMFKLNCVARNSQFKIKF